MALPTEEDAMQRFNNLVDAMTAFVFPHSDFCDLEKKHQNAITDAVVDAVESYCSSTKDRTALTAHTVIKRCESYIDKFEAEGG